MVLHTVTDWIMWIVMGKWMSSARDRFPQNCCEHSKEPNSTGDILNEVPVSPSESLLTELLSVPPLPAVCIIVYLSPDAQLDSSRRVIPALTMPGTRVLSVQKLLSYATVLFHGKKGGYTWCCQRKWLKKGGRCNLFWTYYVPDKPWFPSFFQLSLLQPGKVE